MWLMFDRRLYWHEAWACDLQNSFILGWSPGYLNHLLWLWLWASYLTSLSIRLLGGGRCPLGEEDLVGAGEHWEVLNKTMEGKHLGCSLAQDECSVKGIIVWFCRRISFYPDEAVVAKQGDAECTNLTVVQRAHPGLERVTLKPQNPETHCNLTI